MTMRTLNTHDLTGTRVFEYHPRKDDPDATRKLGKVHACVFHPSEKRCVGILVKRPDAALMFKREDVFVTFGGWSSVADGLLINRDNAASGKAAERALDVSLDDCVLWVGMPLVTKAGDVLGLVGSVSFDADTGAVTHIEVSQGATANALLGQHVIPAENILGFRNISSEDFPGAILVDEVALSAGTEGGAAQAAGKTAAVVVAKARSAASTTKPKVREAAEQASDAANKALYATGRQIGRASGMFAAFKEEYDKARKSDDEET